MIAAVAAAVWGYHSYQVYHATYLRIDEVDYRRDSESLDLSGHPVQELEKVKELTNLKQLDLRGIYHSGTYTSSYMQCNTPIIEINGISVAILSYTQFVNTGTDAYKKSGQLYKMNLLDLAQKLL